MQIQDGLPNNNWLVYIETITLNHFAATYSNCKLVIQLKLEYYQIS